MQSERPHGNTAAALTYNPAVILGLIFSSTASLPSQRLWARLRLASMVKYGLPAPQSAAKQLVHFKWQDGTATQAGPSGTLQPSSSSLRHSAGLVSDSIPALFATQPGSLLPQDGAGYQATDSPPDEPTLANIMLAIQDCKASLSTRHISACIFHC